MIPIYNEARHLEEFFKLLLATAFEFEAEFVVVDDCSRDDSWAIVEKVVRANPDRNILTHRNETNLGKGASLRVGIAMATAEVIAVQDADFEYDPLDLNRLVRPIVEGKADVVFGSRFHSSSPQVHRTFHFLINRFLTLVSNVMSGLFLTDMETCYKVFRSEIIKPLAAGFISNRFGFEPEVTAAVSKLKIRLHEYPVSYFPRSYLEGKKISWKDGFSALWYIMKCNLMPLSPEVLSRIPERFQVRRRLIAKSQYEAS